MSSGMFRTNRISVSYRAITLLRVDVLLRAFHLLQHQSITEPDQLESASPYSFLIIFSHPLQHPAVPGPYVFALFYTYFHELRRASHLL
jgi:hypothetical protein